MFPSPSLPVLHDAAEHEADAPLGPGSVLGSKYLVERVIRRTEMSVVVAARRLSLGDQVVIKLIPPETKLVSEVVERFLREARASSRLTTDHVVAVLDVDTLDSGAPYMVMPLLVGCDLETTLAEEGPLSVERTIDLVLQACEAIAEAHSCGIIHRDLKPANLFLTHRADGSPLVKVLDFGISLTQPRLGLGETRITTTQMIMGTPCYMSPEQLHSTRDVDERTDVWSLGVVLHELLSGKVPFGGDTVPEICASILKDPAPRISKFRDDVPDELERIILRCLEKDLGQRFPDVATLGVALAPFGSASARLSRDRIVRLFRHSGRLRVDGEPCAATLPLEITVELPGMPPKKRRASRLAFAALGLGALCVALGTGYRTLESRLATSAEAAVHRTDTVAPAAPAAPRTIQPPAKQAERSPSLTSARVTTTAAPEELEGPSAMFDESVTPSHVSPPPPSPPSPRPNPTTPPSRKRARTTTTTPDDAPRTNADGIALFQDRK